MFSNAVSHVKMWSREGFSSAESLSFPLASHSDVQVALVFSTFFVSAEEFLVGIGWNDGVLDSRFFYHLRSSR